MVLGSVVSKYCAKSVFFDENRKLFFYINFFFDTNPSFYASSPFIPKLSSLSFEIGAQFFHVHIHSSVHHSVFSLSTTHYSLSSQLPKILWQKRKIAA